MIPSAGRMAAVLVVAAAMGCQGGQRSDDGPAPPPTERTCPKVHGKLRAIPIVYGTLKQDAETSRARWDRKFVYGGATEGRNAPRITDLCEDCGYVYDPRRDVWERESGNTDNFLRPLHPLIQHPPQYEANLKTRPGLYCQTFKGDAVVEESYAGFTAVRMEDVWERILQAVKGADQVRRLEDSPAGKHLRARLKDVEVEATARRDPVTLSTEYHLRVRKGS